MPVAAAYSTQAAHSGAAFRASFLAAFFAALCAAPADRARLTAPSVPGPPLDSAAFFAALFLARCWLSSTSRCHGSAAFHTEASGATEAWARPSVAAVHPPPALVTRALRFHFYAQLSACAG